MGYGSEPKWIDLGLTLEDITEWNGNTAVSPIVPLWAHFRSLSGREIYSMDANLAVEEVVFTVNWKKDIANNMRVIFDRDKYEIVRIDRLDEYKGDLKLYYKRTTAEKLLKTGLLKRH